MVETTEFLSMVRRMLRAAARRVADADEPELATLIELREELDQAIATAVEGQRARGVSWAGIARATGTTRQAAHARWGRPAA
ncbi:AsnC family protein [Agromyces larvae]|uniref:AsnC family protein n=1 Tax=Agromyces larvae TaxID=2929802 RepID=A0ABY4BX03_9MICO|nr:AsnC family protein [Agromyces larvae]UOE43752.1 AsnC family protein [Agromyces larvae]